MLTWQEASADLPAGGHEPVVEGLHVEGMNRVLTLGVWWSFPRFACLQPIGGMQWMWP